MEAHYYNLHKKLDNMQSKYKGNIKQNPKGPQFYPRTVNLTKINFTKEEINLLNQGLKHSTENRLKTYWTDLLMETERAIKLLDVKLRNPFRILAAKKLKQTVNSNNQNGGKQKDRNTS
jgi:hypothetical protein